MNASWSLREPVPRPDHRPDCGARSDREGDLARRRSVPALGVTARVDRASSRRRHEPSPGHGIHEVKTVPRSPWQNLYVDRLVGTLRRECLDHVVVLNETHLRRLLGEYLIYYHGARTHLSLEKDAPEPRPWSAMTKAGSSRHLWSAASTIGTHARRRKILPTGGCTRLPEVTGRPVSAVRLGPIRLTSETPHGTRGPPRVSFGGAPDERPQPVLRTPGWIKRKGQPLRVEDATTSVGGPLERR
jgi:hypothetical protein